MVPNRVGAPAVPGRVEAPAGSGRAGVPERPGRPVGGGSQMHTKNSAKRLTAAVAEACRHAKLRPIRFHDLRHVYASHFVMNGGRPAHPPAGILGHSTPTMFASEVYSHLAPSRLVKESDRVRGRHQPFVGSPRRGSPEPTIAPDLARVRGTTAPSESLGRPPWEATSVGVGWSDLRASPLASQGHCAITRVR